ncbi:MAG TPA: VOC family protein [Pyrinomonadaceae bacterium]|nr:VOC family protein [Pyrinomonadaceae bacterium]
MRLTFLRPLLWTEDLDASIEFYTSVLGFDCHERNDDWGWASLGKDDVFLMLAKPNEHEPNTKIGFSGSFYFTTDDVESLWAKLKDKTKVCYDIETFPWGMREFAIYDNNGYLLQFGQEMDDK